MRNNRGKIGFEANLATLELKLRLARERGALDETGHLNLLLRAREARTIEDLREISRDLAEILRTRKREK